MYIVIIVGLMIVALDYLLVLFKLRDIVRGETKRGCSRINKKQLIQWGGVQIVVVSNDFINFIVTSLIFINIILTFNNYNIISNIIFIIVLCARRRRRKHTREGL